MGFQAPPTQQYPVQILTQQFQFSGQVETVGPAGNFINDPARASLSLHDVHMWPMTPGSPLKGLSRPYAVVMKSHIAFFYLDSPEGRASVSTFTRRELMMVYTPIAVCRGLFPMPAEAKIGDFLGVIPGTLLPIMDVQIFPFTELPAPFPTRAEMMLLGRSHIMYYHPA